MNKTMNKRPRRETCSSPRGVTLTSVGRLVSGRRSCAWHEVVHLARSQVYVPFPDRRVDLAKPRSPDLAGEQPRHRHRGGQRSIPHAVRVPAVEAALGAARRRRPVELLVYLAHRGRRVRALQHGAQLRELADNMWADMLPAIVSRFSGPRRMPGFSAQKLVRVLYTCAFSRSSRVAAQHGAEAPSHGAPLAYPA